MDINIKDLINDSGQYNIDPKYACKFYNLPSKEICDKLYPPIKQQKDFNYYYGYLATVIILMQNPRIARFVWSNWAIIIIIGTAIWEMADS